MEAKTLNNGVQIPSLALGTWLVDDRDVTGAVKEAVRIGYRHVDTAQAYDNERGVGEGIRTCGVRRDKLFVTSKVAAEYKTYREASESIERSLFVTGLDYIDLMLIHSPQPWKEVNQSDDRYMEGNREVWRALEDAYRDGKVRAIGVSNFNRGDIENIWETASVKPMANQVLCHVSNTPFSLIEFCQKKGMVVEAYSPVAHGEAMKNPVIRDIASSYGVTVPQLCIRYCLCLGLVALPKTVNPLHMKANAGVDFSISSEDMERLKSIERIKDYGEASFFPVFGGRL